MTRQPSSFGDIPNNTSKLWYKDPCLRRNTAECLGLCLVIFYLTQTVADDARLLNGLQAIASWGDFANHPKGPILGLYTATLYLPSMATAYLGDFLSQRFGRRVALGVGSLIVLAGSLVNALAVNPGMWVAGRGIIGAGGGIAKVAAPALIQEIAHPRLRPMISCYYYPFFYFGSLSSALLCFNCPESPRWLVYQSRVSDASAVLSKHHANGDDNDPLVQWELAEIQAAIEEDRVDHQVSYLDFFKTPGNRKRLAVLLSLYVGTNWVGNGIVSYYLTPVLKTVGITSPVQITLLTSGLAIWNLFLAFGAALNVERFGRRPLFLVSIFGMLVCYCFIMGFSAGFASTKKAGSRDCYHPRGYLRYYGFYDIAWTPLPVLYTTEILPFKLCIKGLAIFTSIGTMANAFNQFVNPIALEAIAWKYYAVYIGILLFYLVFAWFMYPETKNHTIEEVSVIFDMQDGDLERLSNIVSKKMSKGTAETCEHRE
ncbi:hypothetical protein CEP54_015472 [Fusarium duplospermum]|uniref:Major facilitator superfamily (MFS) profile domain-containing protein n=1 Tax=Fusarium duplospermum TaxID=1325734 RepID=A0A428NNT8_9HYPO|nr:hypothetical protein CEP54_015472 [Fusarium duplospermum]